MKMFCPRRRPPDERETHWQRDAISLQKMRRARLTFKADSLLVGLVACFCIVKAIPSRDVVGVPQSRAVPVYCSESFVY